MDTTHSTAASLSRPLENYELDCSGDSPAMASRSTLHASSCENSIETVCTVSEDKRDEVNWLEG